MYIYIYTGLIIYGVNGVNAELKSAEVRHLRIVFSGLFYAFVMV